MSTGSVMTQRWAERTERYQEDPLTEWFHRWCPLIILCLILGKFCAFLEASARCHGTARSFALSPRLESRGRRSYRETGQYTQRGGPTAQQRKVLRIGSSRQLLCMFLLRNKGGRVDLESLGGTSEHSSALSSTVGPVLFTQGTCGGRWRTFCCM